MTQIENTLVRKIADKGAYETFYKENPPFAHNVQVFGKMGVVVYVNRKMKPKFSNNG